MGRRFYIVSYDITDDRRRNRVAKTLVDFGDRVQYSVFSCQLNPREKIRMKRALSEVIDTKADQVLVVGAGPVRGQHPQPEVEYLGVYHEEPSRSLIV